MATIKHVEEFKKSNGKKTWKFTMDDGTEGYSHPDNAEKPWEYKEGDVLNVKVENKETYNLLHFTRGETPPKDDRTPPPPKVELGKDRLIEFKMQLRRDVIRTIGVAASAGRIEPKEMAEYYNEFYMATDASVDELCK